MLSRMLISGIFIGSNFLASFLVILLIVNSNTLELQSEFFIFQSLFFPMITAVSQLNIIRNYRTSEKGNSLKIDAIVVLIFAVLFQLLYRESSFIATCFYALSLPLTVRASVMLAEAQFSIKKASVVLIPIISALVRVILVYTFRENLKPSVLFFINSVSLATLVWVLYIILKRNLLNISDVRNSKDSFNPKLMFAFLIISSLFFQWDRYIFSLADKKNLIVQSGIYFTLVLPPISMLFAVIFRGNATQIFRESTSLDRNQTILLSGALFAIPALLYAVTLTLFWGFIPLLFKDAAGMSVVPAIILIFALIFERLGNLIIYSREGQEKLGNMAIIKLICLLLAACSTIFVFNPNIVVMYFHYLCAALLFFISCWRFR